MVILKLCSPVIVEVPSLLLYVFRIVFEVVGFAGVGLFEGVVGLLQLYEVLMGIGRLWALGYVVGVVLLGQVEEALLYLLGGGLR